MDCCFQAGVAAWPRRSEFGVVQRTFVSARPAVPSAERKRLVVTMNAEEQKHDEQARRQFLFSAVATALVAVTTTFEGSAKAESSGTKDEIDSFTRVAPVAVVVPTVLTNMLSSAAARGLGVAVVHPLDTVKTTLQANRNKELTGLRAVDNLFQRKGFKGFYAGLGGSLTGQIPYAGVTFAVFERLKEIILPMAPSDWRILILLLCGSLGDMCGSMVVVPSEVVKTRLQTGRYQSAPEAITAIMNSEEGFKGLYSGYSAQLIRDVPFRAIQVTTFETLKLAWMESLARGLVPTENLLAGLMAGSVAAALTTPLDVVKTRMMSQQKGDAETYTSPADAAIQIWTNEGPGAFFKGLVPRVALITPMSGIFFFCYEYFKQVINHL